MEPMMRVFRPEVSGPEELDEARGEERNVASWKCWCKMATDQVR